MPPCLALIGSHFLFCKPWPKDDPACGGNPFTEATGFARSALQYIQNLPDVCKKANWRFFDLSQHDRYLDQIKTIQLAISELDILSECTPTSNAYKAAKSSLCWDINNNATIVSVLLLVQTPLLLVLLCVMLYAWNAFGSGYGIGTTFFFFCVLTILSILWVSLRW